MQYELTTPCTAADLAPLKAGDTVSLSGVVSTARDQAHKRMLEALDKRAKSCPLTSRAAPSTTSAPRRSARAKSSALPAPPPADGWTP